MLYLSPRWRTTLDSMTNLQNMKRPPDVCFGRTASLIVPRLYLSDAATAKDENELRRLGITHVVSILEYDITIPNVIPQKHKLHISLVDKPESDILSHLTTTTKFITSALAKNEKNKVLVHCFQGISRSATVVIAYLIASSGMRASEALEYTQAKRSIVWPNSGFRKQLDTYARGFVGGQTKGTKVKIREGIVAQRIRQLKILAQLKSGYRSLENHRTKNEVKHQSYINFK